MFHLDHIEGLGVAAAEVAGLLEEVAVMGQAERFLRSTLIRSS